MEGIQFLLSFFIAVLIVDHQSEATATFEWTLLKFVNPGGKKNDGGKCEWYNDCDHKFRFGMDWITGNNNAQYTPILTKQTGVFDNQNSNTFSSGSDNNGVYNPITYQFNTWQGGVQLKLYVIDDDGVFGYDYVDSIVYKLMAQPSAGILTSIPVSTVMSARTSLYFTYRIYCDDYYYGNDCTKYCKGHDDNINGHYSCDLSGNKVCLSGWENEDNNCKDRQNDCETNNCQNNALCIDGIRSYTCQCKPGYTGKFCENNIDECQSNPCQNGGTCTDGVNQFTCQCKPAFVGKVCNETACHVLSPCQNGGTCYDAGKCLCPPSFVGDVCSIPLCNKTGCLNGGKCSIDGSCACPPGINGSMCDVILCNVISNYCMNGGICKNGKCECPSDFIGPACEENIVCKHTTCQNEGQCKPIVTNFSTSYMPKCFCPAGFSGAYCEIIPQTQAVKYDPALAYIPVNQEDSKKYTPLEILFIFFVIMTIVLLIICIILSALLCKSRRRIRGKTGRQETITSVASDYSTSSEVFSDFGKGTYSESIFPDTIRSISNFPKTNTVTSSVLPNVYTSDDKEEKGYLNQIFDDTTYSSLEESEIGTDKSVKNNVDNDDEIIVKNAD